MKQSIVYVTAYHHDDLECKIQEEIDSFYEIGQCLVNIQYFCMEDEECPSHVFLLFNECKKNSNECSYDKEMDSRCDKKARCVKKVSSCEEGRENSCC